MRPKIGVDLRPLLEDFESGVKVYTREILNEMMKNSDFEFDLFYQSRKRVDKIHHVFPTARHIPISNILLHIKSIFNFQLLPDDYFERKPNLIWIPDRRPFYKIDIPIVMTIHDFVPELFPMSMSLKARVWHFFFSYRRLKKHCAGFLVPSLSTASSLGLDSPPFEVTFEGAKISKNMQAPLKSKKILSKDYFLSISPADPRKGLKKIYKLAMFFPNLNFVIAGIKKNDKRFSIFNKKSYSNLITLNEISEDEKSWLLHHAKGYLALSEYEGFDLPVLEAVKAKCPVILSDISVHRELYISNFFIKKEAELILAVKKVQMGYGEIPKLRGDYSWENAAKRALLFFSRVINNENRK